MKFELIREEYSPSYRPGAGGENNGGNYPQPFYYIRDNLGNDWLLDDSSCGDFGTRRMLWCSDQVVAYWGTMLEEDCQYSLLSGYAANQLSVLLGGIWVLGGGRPVRR